ncbi:GTPase ObgE [Salidesulfovibrio onnuriiensis]|uniref:GTPase ObgE n=1 Tax=Salidesulfovibrio onnuriiensis TaxID=2583823 RepID=UPI0011CBB56E|nr:GTPase ObgE [Salidesulfovibrio onnuriiensis]
MRFVDEATITVQSGKGGNGCASLRREANRPKGGPDGGDGGKGGDVILRASNRLVTLYDFRLKRRYAARNGQPGMGRDKYGKAADDLYIDLPVGTLIYEVTEDEEGNRSEKLVADLVRDGVEMIICQGGDGGRGNIHFKSSVNRTPRYAEEGFPGQEKVLRLELKVLADVGLLGLPNAGKSTFITQVSAARPKIAAYPFTTLVPNLGVVEADNFERMVIADIPGLIEGASEGAGLGHTFLKHVERTRFLVHILAADDLNREDPLDGYNMLNEELERFNPEMAAKAQIKVINKIDTLSPEELDDIKAKCEGEQVYFISALNGDGVEPLLDVMWKQLREMNAAEQEAEADGQESD